jgi:hypothetical protein
LWNFAKSNPSNKRICWLGPGNSWLDGMPLYRPLGKWRHKGNEFACRGDIPKPLLGSGMVDNPAGTQRSNVQHRSGSCHRAFDIPKGR